jgi:hypothetical protein
MGSKTSFFCAIFALKPYGAAKKAGYENPNNKICRHRKKKDLQASCAFLYFLQK